MHILVIDKWDDLGRKGIISKSWCWIWTVQSLSHLFPQSSFHVEGIIQSWEFLRRFWNERCILMFSFPSSLLFFHSVLPICMQISQGQLLTVRFCPLATCEWYSKCPFVQQFMPHSKVGTMQIYSQSLCERSIQCLNQSQPFHIHSTGPSPLVSLLFACLPFNLCRRWPEFRSREWCYWLIHPSTSKATIEYYLYFKGN